jgi:hypothetical protein
MDVGLPLMKHTLRIETGKTSTILYVEIHFYMDIFLPACHQNLCSPEPACVPSSSENNKPPVADAGPEKELTLPVDRTTLDGSKSTDDQNISTYHWKQSKSVIADRQTRQTEPPTHPTCT